MGGGGVFCYTFNLYHTLRRLSKTLQVRENLLVTSIFSFFPTMFFTFFNKTPSSHSSACSMKDLSTGSRWFDPLFGQYSFPGLMTVIATGFIPLSLLFTASTMVMWESTQGLGKNIVQTTGKKKLQGSMDRCTGH